MGTAPVENKLSERGQCIWLTMHRLTTTVPFIRELKIRKWAHTYLALLQRAWAGRYALQEQRQVFLQLAWENLRAADAITAHLRGGRESRKLEMISFFLIIVDGFTPIGYERAQIEGLTLEVFSRLSNTSIKRSEPRLSALENMARPPQVIDMMEHWKRIEAKMKQKRAEEIRRVEEMAQQARAD